MRQAVDRVRNAPPARDEMDVVAADVNVRAKELLRSGPTEVINGTGTILHTNLGRAPLSTAAITAMGEAARYSDLEYDLVSGNRGARVDHVEPLLNLLLGCEASTTVCNNAAGLLLALTALTAGKEIIVSRGQAVEIGDGFRLPEIVRQSRAKLVEVGTTNRTIVDDYVAAVTPKTAALLHVHASNFRVVGFSRQPSLAELALAARECGLLLVADNGSGPLIDTATFGLMHEPMPREALVAGADVVTFSTDKLMGGPQGGVVAGKADLIGRISRHPMARAVRPDKTSLAALRATAQQYATGELDAIPVIRMLRADENELRRRAEQVAEAAKLRGLDARVERSESTIGGGSLPGQTLSTYVIAIASPWKAHELAARLRARPVPIVVRVQRGRVLLDLRTVQTQQDSTLIAELCDLAPDSRENG